MSLQQPVCIVIFNELGDGPSCLLQVFEDVDIEDLLLKRPVEALDDAVALRAADKGWGELQTEVFHLPHKVM